MSAELYENVVSAVLTGHLTALNTLADVAKDPRATGSERVLAAQTLLEVRVDESPFLLGEGEDDPQPSPEFDLDEIVRDREAVETDHLHFGGDGSDEYVGLADDPPPGDVEVATLVPATPESLAEVERKLAAAQVGGDEPVERPFGGNSGVGGARASRRARRRR